MTHLIAEFTGHPAEHEWSRAYERACRAAEEGRSVEIVDVTEARGDVPLSPDVIMKVVRPADVQSGATREEIEAAAARQSQSLTSLSLSACGQQCADAATAIMTWIGAAPDGLRRVVRAAATVDDLFQILVDFLLMEVDIRHPQRRVSSIAEEAAQMLEYELPRSQSDAATSPGYYMQGLS